ncbi:hypothetical protein V492_02016 [Pseudogymnoascus sp. VKM F-4246]|nr:hypothetical protein V492_02016 [Pseudogymnoascus sp. VKM F-4246]
MGTVLRTGCPALLGLTTKPIPTIRSGYTRLRIELMSRPLEIDGIEACLSQYGHSRETTYRHLSMLSGAHLSSIHHRNHGRPSKREAAYDRQYLTYEEEEVIATCLLSMAQSGYRLPRKFLRKLAHYVKRQRNSIEPVYQYQPEGDGARIPSKNWSTAFWKRHPTIKNALEIPKKNTKKCDQHIFDHIDAWINIIAPKLDTLKALNKNTYHVVVIGGILKFPAIIPEIVSEDTIHAYLNANDEGKVLTAIECSGMDGQFINPLIISPTVAERNQTLDHVLNCHHDQSSNGYLNSEVTIKWVTNIFEPQTRALANGRPRFLISDVLTYYITHEFRVFCKENRIHLCGLHSNVVQRLQFYTASSSKQLQISLREEYSRAYSHSRDCEKPQFSLLYDRARRRAIDLHTAKAQFQDEDSSEASIDFSASNVEDSPQTTEDTAQTTKDTPKTVEELISLRQDIENDLKCEALSEAMKGRIQNLLDIAMIGATI